jgi:hypothetical protein
MSGKIEISRELARLLYQDTISCWGVGGNAANQLRAILSAPIAERQGPAAWINPKKLEELTPSGMVYVTGFDLGDSIPLYTSLPAPVAVDERAEFENHYRDRIMGNRTGVRFLRSASGSYLDSEVREMWSGWQARACLDKVKELNYQGHASDCSTNNRGVPELLGPCDCDLSKKTP